MHKTSVRDTNVLLTVEVTRKNVKKKRMIAPMFYIVCYEMVASGKPIQYLISSCGEKLCRLYFS